MRGILHIYPSISPCIADRRYAEIPAVCTRFIMGVPMNQRDQELLDKQLRWLRPSPPNAGVMVLAIVAVFVAGITLGGTVFAHESDPMQIVSNDATAAIYAVKDAPLGAVQTQLSE